MSAAAFTWGYRERGTYLWGLRCRCARRTYAVETADGRHVRCDGCGEAAPDWCLCPQLPGVSA